VTGLCGLNHVGVVTTDLERFLAFYRTTFDAPTVHDTTDNGVRSALIDVGGSFLQVFAAAGDNTAHPDRPDSRSGRLNHFALSVPTRDAFFEIRRRLMDAGRTEGSVRDFGAAWSLRYHDPDGFESELIWTTDPHARFATPPRILAEPEGLTTARLAALPELPDPEYELGG
jgi:catechol 2,3-dioxygenase-like lactoylglutathione lyase family enzyme